MSAMGDSYNEKQKIYVKTNGPVPEYLTAGKVYEARDFDGLGFAMTDDSGKSWWNLMVKYSWTLCDQHGNPVAEQSRPTIGEFRSVAAEVLAERAEPDYKAERDRYKALAGELAELVGMVRWADYGSKACAQASAALAKYEQEKGND